MIKGTLITNKALAKAGEFKVPNLKGVATATARLDRLRTEGTFVVQIEKVKAIVTLEGKSAIIPEFTLAVIEDQRPTTDLEGNAATPHRVGNKCACYFELGGKYGYGERDWASFLEACGLVTDEERDAEQASILGEENPLGTGGMMIRIKNVKKDSGHLNPYFSAYEVDEAKSA